MKVQIRSNDGGIQNKEIDDSYTIMMELKNHETQKLSFDLIDSRLALYPDGTYQIFGGLVNHPDLHG